MNSIWEQEAFAKEKSDRARNKRSQTFNKLDE